VIITAFDPGYTKAGVAQIEVFEDGIFVEHTGVIFPAWQAPGKSLLKVDAMIKGLEGFKAEHPQFFVADAVVVEAQESYPRRGANANVLIRMGKVAGAFYALVAAEKKLFVLPKTWTQSRSKEQNHPKIFARIENKDPAHWPWATKTLASNYEHAVDAVGMALWMYEQTKEKENG
jgi:hypothetical protein